MPQDLPKTWGSRTMEVAAEEKGTQGDLKAFLNANYIARVDIPSQLINLGYSFPHHSTI